MDWTKPISITNNTFSAYAIGSMEAPAENDGGVGWRQYITPRLNWRGIFVFDPTREELAKIGLPTPEFMEKLNGLILSEQWEEFLENMDKVWKGKTFAEKLLNGTYNLVRILGDIDYVYGSKFLVWHHKDGDKPGGTIVELILAWMRGIPVYLVTEMPIIKMNKSILYFLLDSGHRQGRIFKNFDDLLTFLDVKYNLSIPFCEYFDGGTCINDEEFPEGTPTEISGRYCNKCKRYSPSKKIEGKNV